MPLAAKAVADGPRSAADLWRRGGADDVRHDISTRSADGRQLRTWRDEDAGAGGERCSDPPDLPRKIGRAMPGSSGGRPNAGASWTETTGEAEQDAVFAVISRPPRTETAASSSA